ncbi:hypothetical protein [Streptomyces bohaiensis]|uniref:Uncharacterized protein n=1 Tax=Streptomyces bohaiensis TaxID=1431344 RepID=A0ABX1C642_9ACTN|nr:hypothetical protein [Streptomyces bohaiensis]NJQ13518.1 hypothetical protein [Streptomyces bohaiensis]
MTQQRTRAQNQAALWKRKQEEASTRGEAAVAAVCFDAARLVCKQRPELWPELAALLNGFYERNSR